MCMRTISEVVCDDSFRPRSRVSTMLEDWMADRDLPTMSPAREYFTGPVTSEAVMLPRDMIVNAASVSL